jgi:hypothetical protein
MTLLLLLDKNRTENPMVNEKVAAGKTKSPGEVEQETKAKRDVKDTSTLVEKDTGKVKGVWKDNDKDSQPKATPSTPSTSSTPASLSKNEDTSSKVDHDSSDADKHWDVKSKIDTDRFGGDKDLKTQAESKINEFRKSSVDNLNELGNEAKNDLTTLKEKAGEQVETAKEWAQEGVQEIQDGLQKAQEKVSNAISKDK